MLTRHKLACVSGSAELRIDGNQYLNLFSNLSSSDDFTTIRDDYDFIRVKDFVVTVRRIATEATMTATGLPSESVFIGYLPRYTSLSNNTLILRQETAMIVPALSLAAHSKKYKICKFISSVGEVPGFYIPQDYWIDTYSLPYVSGCLLVNWNNATFALEDGVLYDVEIRYNVQMACPV